MKSIIQNEKFCYVCGTTYGLEEHHVIGGTANRKQSEKYGLKVWLCPEHHRGNSGVHFNKERDLEIKKLAQETFEREHTREEFRAIFGKSWL